MKLDGQLERRPMTKAELLDSVTKSANVSRADAERTIGAFCGPLLTKFLLAHIGFSGVMVLPAIFLELAVVGSWQIKRIARGYEHVREDAPLPESPWTGLAKTIKSRYLSSLAAFTLLTAIAATFVYYAQANLVKVELPDRLARTDYFATLDLWQQGATFLVQLVVAPLLLRRFGPGPVLCLLPILQAAGLIGFWLAPSIAMIAALHISSRTVALGLTRPARELCFTVVSRDDKYRAKNVIDTLMYRAGDFVSSWIFLALGLGGGLISLTIPMAIGWVAIAIWLGFEFRRRTA
jgi:AAA family ATP:ADP antiporter